MSYIEVICLDGNDAVKTGLGAEFETQALTWAAFTAAKRHAVPSDKATFVIDYYNRRGDLCDNVFLDDAGFMRVTGEAPKPLDFYRAHDAAHWAIVRAGMAAKASLQKGGAA